MLMRTLTKTCFSLIVICAALAIAHSARAAETASSPASDKQFCRAKANLEKVDTRALRMAINDLTRTYPNSYKQGPQYLKRLDANSSSVMQTSKATRRLSLISGPPPSNRLNQHPHL